jgi:large subunit ribosomal protein L4
MEVKVYKIDGSATNKTVSLDDAIFGIEPHEHSIWLTVKATLANRRQGTHKIKGRSEVAGSTKKLFRQKGTGRARQGDIKSPLHPGGGTMHGPQPHRYYQDVPKKVKQLARKSALSQKAKTNAVYVVEDLNMTEPKTKRFSQLITALKLDGKNTMLMTASHNQLAYLSGRNIPTLSVSEAALASTYDIWRNRALIIEESALKALTESFSGGVRNKEVTPISLVTE